MNEHKQPTEYAQTDVTTYQTGSTKPPKSHVGMVAFLLSVVIFFCGISTILSLMRINLLQKRNAQTESPRPKVSFVAQSTEPETCALGIQGQTLPDIWQDYRALPEGVFITYVPDEQTVHVGDILQTVNGQPVTSWDELQSVLNQYHPGDQVTVTVYRDGSHKQYLLMIKR